MSTRLWLRLVAHPTPPRTSSHIGEGLRSSAAISQLVNLTFTNTDFLRDGQRCLSPWSMTRILS